MSAQDRLWRSGHPAEISLRCPRTSRICKWNPNILALIVFEISALIRTDKQTNRRRDGHVYPAVPQLSISAQSSRSRLRRRQSIQRRRQSCMQRRQRDPLSVGVRKENAQMRTHKKLGRRLEAQPLRERSLCFGRSEGKVRQFFVG